MLLIITISTFICFTLGAIGIYWLLFRPASAATERLKRLNEKGVPGATAVAFAEDNQASDLAERIAGPISRLLPPSAAEAHKLQRQLMQAGFRSHNAPIIYRAIQLLSLAGFPGLVALTCAMMGRPVESAVLWILFSFVMGFFLPRYILRRMVRNRQQRVLWGLADALDLMVV